MQAKNSSAALRKQDLPLSLPPKAIDYALEPKLGNCVYFIQMVLAPSIFKIGYTSDIHGRAMMLQVACPFKLRIAAQIMDGIKFNGVEVSAKKFERALHKRFGLQKLRGEWFLVGRDDFYNLRHDCSSNGKWIDVNPPLISQLGLSNLIDQIAEAESKEVI